MKALFFTPLAVLPLLSVAHAEVVRTHLEAALDVQQAWLAGIQELTGILQQIHDKESADAAAPAVHDMAQRLQALQKEAAGFAPPTAKEEAEFKAALRTTEIKKVVNDFMKAVITLASANTYGSAALSLELENLLGKH